MMAAASSITTSTTTTRRRTSPKHIIIKKLPQPSHELVSSNTAITNRKQNNSKRAHNQTKVKETLYSNNNNNSDISNTPNNIDTTTTSASNNYMMLLNNNNNNDFTYNANAIGSGNVRRIRTPAPHDVLSGRGGSVNAHPGNCQFRDWVHVRKEEYNLARSKQAKADICREIILKVTSLGGRFLTKESPTSQWWVEQDDERMMSKTSQALREGAPKIREAHRDELGLPNASSRRKLNATSVPQPIKSSATVTTTSSSSLKRPFTKGATGDGKRVRVNYNGQAVYPNEHSPPLRSTPEPQTVGSSSNDNMTELQITPSSLQLLRRPFRFPPPLRSNITSNQNNSTGYRRSNSLATSDIVNVDENYEFVNPFEDESHLFDPPSTTAIVPPNERSLSTDSALSSSSNDSFVMGNKKTVLKSGLLRDSSVSSTTTDYAGYGALLSGISTNNHFSDSLRSINSLGNISMQSDANNTTTTTNAHIVPLRSTSMGSVSTAELDGTTNTQHRPSNEEEDDDDDDDRSAVTEATIGLPLWDWFNRDVSTSVPEKTAATTTAASDVPLPTTTTDTTAKIIASGTTTIEQQQQQRIPII